jgi:hypothetical protein
VDLWTFRNVDHQEPAASEIDAIDGNQQRRLSQPPDGMSNSVRVEIGSHECLRTARLISDAKDRAPTPTVGETDGSLCQGSEGRLGAIRMIRLELQRLRLVGISRVAPLDGIEHELETAGHQLSLLEFCASDSSEVV